MKVGDRVALKEDRAVQGTVIALLDRGGFAVRFDGQRGPDGRMRRGLKFSYGAHREGFIPAPKVVTRET